MLRIVAPKKKVEIARAPILPIRSLTSPMINPPAIHPKMKQELIKAPNSPISKEETSLLCKSVIISGRYTEIKVDTVPAKR